jgi:hypothetical protein
VTECGGCGLSSGVYSYEHGAPLNFDVLNPYNEGNPITSALTLENQTSDMYLNM